MKSKYILSLLLLSLLLAACGVDGKHFRLEGRILNMNQGEFYIYNDEGMIEGIDTIKVVGGRFSYEMECKLPTTLMLVFPNFSEQPIYAEPGKSVDIQGDASHLKELKVKGTEDNKLMTDFRAQISNVTPPEIKKFARQMIEDHPKSKVGVYLVKKYFITAATPDYGEASRLIKIMTAAQPDNGKLKLLATHVEQLKKSDIGQPILSFVTHDTKGRMVSSSDLSTNLAVVCTWATWSYESIDMLRKLKESQRKSAGRLKVVSIAVDASRVECEQQLKRDSIQWSNICDGKMLETKAVQQLGLTAVPDNILIKNGKIIARSIPVSDIQTTIDKNL